MIKLLKISPRSVRGIPKSWEDLPFGKRGLVVQGDNGTGKSSLVDALEYVLTRRSSLFPANRKGVSWDKAAPHVRSGAPQIKLMVGIDGNELEIANTGPLSPDAKSVVDVAARSRFVLRRHMLLDFIAADPAHRYDALEPFLNLDAYSQFESRLRQLQADLKGRFDPAKTKLESAQAALRLRTNVPATQPLDEAAIVASVAGSVVSFGADFDFARGTSLDTLGTALKQAAAALSISEEATRIIAAKAEFSKSLKFSNLAPLVRVYAEKISEHAAAAVEQSAAKLSTLLEAASAFVEQEEPNSCPVCEQPVDAAALRSRLKARVSEFAQFQATARALSKSATDLRAASELALSQLASLAAAWAKIGAPLPPEIDAARSQAESLSRLAGGSQPLSDGLQQQVAASIAGLPDIITICVEHLTRLLEDSGSLQTKERLEDAVRLAEAAARDLTEIEELKKRRDRLGLKLASICRAVDLAETARKKVVQQTLDAVSSIANAYYEAIHLGEGLAGSKLSVREATAASVELAAPFDGQEEHPLLHYSESHLDTLGLCYFLALRRREADAEPNFRILVLDDVLHSVDAAHRGRVAALLKDRFADHQLVLTTHDPAFFLNLRERLGAGEMKYVKLVSWDLQSGPRLADGKTDIDRVTNQALRETLDIEELCAACGRFSEQVMARLADRLQVATPHRESGRYTIGDLWPPLLAKMKKQKGFVEPHLTVLESIEYNKWLRNEMGAHFNEPPAPVTLAEARELAQALARLYELTHCENCGEYIAKTAADYWNCPCGSLSYSPKSPSPSAAENAATS